MDKGQDPVMMSDGGVYDKEPISQWLSLRDTAPCTNEDEGASRDVMELHIRKDEQEPPAWQCVRGCDDEGPDS